MKATEEVKWSRDEVRTMCVRNDWYKSGSNAEYIAMLDTVEDSEPTLSNIMLVARDIAAHTRDLNPDDPEHVCYVMFEINRTSIRRFYYVEKEEGDEWQ